MIGDAHTVELGRCLECGAPGTGYHTIRGGRAWTCDAHANSPHVLRALA